MATLSVRLLGVFDFVSNNAGLIRANAGLISALVALTGVLIAQVVNTYIAISARRNQLELEDRRARAASLQSYLEQVGKLLIDHSMHNSKNADDSSLAAKGEEFSADAARVVAQAQTLAVLEGLGTEPTRKRILLQFLYEAGFINKDEPIISLAKANLSGADLRGADLREADLSGAFLSRADLKGTNLSGACLRETVFYRADLWYVQMREADLRRADLSEVKLFDADLREADLSEATLIGAELRGVLYTSPLRGDAGIESNLNRVNMSRANLWKAKLVGVDLSGANLSRAYMVRANLKNTSLTGANLREAKLERANLKGTYLKGTDLSEATNLTQKQVDQSDDGNEITKLPPHLKPPAHWDVKADEQPEDA